MTIMRLSLKVCSYCPGIALWKSTEFYNVACNEHKGRLQDDE